MDFTIVICDKRAQLSYQFFDLNLEFGVVMPGAGLESTLLPAGILNPLCLNFTTGHRVAFQQGVRRRA